jgi:hypothetical protein
VQNFRVFPTRIIGSPYIKLSWKRPLATKASDVTFYVIQCFNTPVQPEINGGRGVVNGVAGLTTETSFVLEPLYVGANYFWVTGYNGAGWGVSSDLLFYNAPGKIA